MPPAAIKSPCPAAQFGLCLKRAPLAHGRAVAAIGRSLHRLPLQLRFSRNEFVPLTFVRPELTSVAFEVTYVAPLAWTRSQCSLTARSHRLVLAEGSAGAFFLRV